VVNYTYDNNGNLTTDGTQTHTWDYQNRLVQTDITGGGGGGGGSSGTALFSDSFTESSNTLLTAHTPNTGTGWSEVNAVGSLRMQVDGTADNLLPNGTSSTDGQTATANATYSSANYQVTTKLVAAPSGSDEYVMLYGRYTGQANNGYYSANLGTSTSNDPAIRKGTGTTTETGLVVHDNSNGIIMNAGDVVTFELSGSDLALFGNNEVADLYVTDSSITQAGKPALGMGGYWVDGSGDMDTAVQKVDDFQVLTIGTANTGWQSPSATGQTHNQWTNPTNGYSSNNSRATINADTLVGTGSQDYGNFGLSIPSGDTVRGIEVKVESLTDSSGYHDLAIAVSKDNGSTWFAEKTIRYEDFDSVDGTKLAGHARSLWGLSWSPADLANANFKVKVRLAGRESTGVDDLGIDHIAVKVFYDTAGGGSGSTVTYAYDHTENRVKLNNGITTTIYASDSYNIRPVAF